MPDHNDDTIKLSSVYNSKEEDFAELFCSGVSLITITGFLSRNFLKATPPPDKIKN